MLTTDKAYYTTQDVARLYGATAQQVRRTVDSLGVPMQRVGLYRLIPAELLEPVRAKMIEAGYLREAEVATAG